MFDCGNYRGRRSIGIAVVLLVLVMGVLATIGSRSAAAEDTLQIATEAYIYGYPLVTMDMTRKFLTNVAALEAASAPMGQLIKLRTYPAVDNHAVTAPNADTLYTMVWLDVAKEPGSSASPIWAIVTT